jgi:hypothetical protein
MFCVKIGKSTSVTSAQLILAYGECTVNKSSVFKWRRRFMERQEDVQVNSEMKGMWKHSNFIQ